MGTANVGHGIVVGIDGSDSALDAARWAACVARRLGEPIDLVHVHPPPPATGPTRRRKPF